MCWVRIPPLPFVSFNFKAAERVVIGNLPPQAATGKGCTPPQKGKYRRWKDPWYFNLWNKYTHPYLVRISSSQSEIYHQKKLCSYQLRKLNTKTIRWSLVYWQDHFWKYDDEGEIGSVKHDLRRNNTQFNKILEICVYLSPWWFNSSKNSQSFKKKKKTEEKKWFIPFKKKTF